jgi:hypothetical protein
MQMLLVRPNCMLAKVLVCFKYTQVMLINEAKNCSIFQPMVMACFVCLLVGTMCGAATFSIMTFSMMTFGIMTFSITTFSITLRKYDIQHNDTQHNDSYAKCRYTECHGARCAQG